MDAETKLASKFYHIFGIYLIAIIVLFNHRSNIKRLLNGTENKIDFKKS